MSDRQTGRWCFHCERRTLHKSLHVFDPFRCQRCGSLNSLGWRGVVGGFLILLAIGFGLGAVAALGRQMPLAMFLCASAAAAAFVGAMAARREDE